MIPAMANLESIRVSLRVFGETLEPEEVSALLGAQPSSAQRKGDEVTPLGVKAETGSWILESDHGPGSDLEEQVESLFEKLSKDFDEWASLTSRYSADVACRLRVSTGSENFDLSPRIAQGLADRGLAIGFSLES